MRWLTLVIILFSGYFIQVNSQNFLSHKIIHEVKKLVLTERKTLKLSSYIDQLSNIKDVNVKNEEVCKTCNGTVWEIINWRRQRMTKDEFMKHMYNLCQVFTSWGSIGCRGYINIETDTVLYMIDNKKDLTAERVCSIYLQVNKCKDPSRIDWDINVPPISDYTDEENDKNLNDTLNILQLTDIHFDPYYMPGSNAKCKDPLCCQIGSGEPDSPESAAGYWGDYNVCDMPWHSVQNLLTQVLSHDNIDFVYYTGDIISHRSWDTTIKSNTESIRTLYSEFYSKFGRIKVYPIVGNHEAHPTNFFVNAHNESISTQWLFDLVADEWSRWLPKSTLSTVKKGGYYTVLLKPGYRIIALNSNVCYVSNLWLFYNDTDPYGQLQWFVNTLKAAEDKNENVHILSHVPPGNVDCLKNWNEVYNKIIVRFAHIIKAQFNGHTHYDEFRLFYNDDKSKVVNVAYNGGSFTTFVGFNPNYRIYSVDSNQFYVTNYEQWMYNMSEANLNPSVGPKWVNLYTFKEAYGLQSLKYDELAKLINNMSKNKKLVEQYYRYQVRESGAAMAKGCDDECLKGKLCAITSVHTDDAILCNDS